MARVLAKHGIEQFVIFWISKFRNDANIRSQRKFIEKAIKQISFFLNPPCCIDPEATIEFRRLDNDLTRFITAQLANKLDKRKWKKSLERAKTALENLLVDPCCPPTSDEGIIQVDENAGTADIASVTVQGLPGYPIFLTGANLPLFGGQVGVFRILSGTRTITVSGDNVEAGLLWRVTGSDGVIQELPYVGGVPAIFNNVVISSIEQWIIEIVLE